MDFLNSYFRWNQEKIYIEFISFLLVAAEESVTFKIMEVYGMFCLRSSRKCLLAAQRPVTCKFREFVNSAFNWLFHLQDLSAAAEQKLSWL